MTKETTGNTNPFENPFTHSLYSMDYIRNVMNWGIKAQQTWMDQTMKTNQVMTQFMIDQTGEAAKIAQELFKQTMAVSEDLVKGFTQATTFKN